MVAAKRQDQPGMASDIPIDGSAVIAGSLTPDLTRVGLAQVRYLIIQA